MDSISYVGSCRLVSADNPHIDLKGCEMNQILQKKGPVSDIKNGQFNEIFKLITGRSLFHYNLRLYIAVYKRGSG